MLVVAEREQLPVPQARAGEPGAWDVLFRRYQLPLYVYVFELVRDEQVTLDVVQETFIAAVRISVGCGTMKSLGAGYSASRIKNASNDGESKIARRNCVMRWVRQRLNMKKDRMTGSFARSRKLSLRNC